MLLKKNVHFGYIWLDLLDSGYLGAALNIKCLSLVTSLLSYFFVCILFFFLGLNVAKTTATDINRSQMFGIDNCVFISWISITNLVIPFPIYIQDRKTDVDLDKVSFFPIHSVSQFYFQILKYILFNLWVF